MAATQNPASVERKLWTRDEYATLVEAFPEQRFELIEGELNDKMGQKPSHARVTAILNELLTTRYPGKTRIQAPITLPEPEGIRSEPEPDVVLLNKHVRSVPGHPTPDDIELLIEVADTSLQMDSHLKARLYARCRIREYWIVDVQRRRLLTFSVPAGEEYRASRIYTADEDVVSASGLTMKVSELFD